MLLKYIKAGFNRGTGWQCWKRWCGWAVIATEHLTP